MKPALSQICSLNSPFEVDVEEYSAGHCEAIEGWLTKIEQYLHNHSVADLLALLERHGVEMPVASFQGGLLVSQGEARKQAWQLFARRLDLCSQLGVQTIVVACDVRGPLQQIDVERVQKSLVEAAQLAGRHQVRAALEFQGDAAIGNNLQTAAALVDEVASPHLGLCLDLFHYHVGPSKPQDLGYLQQANLFHVQICDIADIPREFASDADRILPGDGEIHLNPVIERLRAIDYGGYVSVELMNPQVWQVPPRQFGEIAITALRKLLGEAKL